MMPTWLMILVAGFAYIFLLGIQQQNITHENHFFSFISCYLLALTFAVLISELQNTTVLAFTFLYGTGSAIGASLSIVVHKRWMRKPDSFIP